MLNEVAGRARTPTRACVTLLRFVRMIFRAEPELFLLRHCPLTREGMNSITVPSPRLDERCVLNLLRFGQHEPYLVGGDLTLRFAQGGRQKAPKPALNLGAQRPEGRA